jgi:hypothetical protein
MVSVPDSKIVFPLLGRPHDSLPKYGEAYNFSHSTDRGVISDAFNVSYPTYLGATFDASTTNLTYRIPAPSENLDSAEITLSFLSPITPSSTLRQSIPASYITIHVNGEFDIDVYMDLNGLWVSANRGNQIVWELDRTQENDQGKQSVPLKKWKVKRAQEEFLTEYDDRAEWGTLYFTGPADVKHEAGTSALLRQRFAKTGTLRNVIDGNFRGIMDEEPVFAFAKSFKLSGTSRSTKKISDSVLFTIAHIQDPVIQFASARGMTLMRPLWASYFLSADDLLGFHYRDFNNAFNLASNYSEQLEKDALKSGSEDYKDILALSARQVLGACSFSGTLESPLIFFKEISSDGNMNTVDVIYPAFPFFLYTNPKWLAWLMEPLIEHQLSGQYP